MKELSKKELADILDNVATEVAILVKNEKEAEEKTLKKADPGEETPAEKTAEGSSTEESTPAIAAPGTDAPADVPPAAEEVSAEASPEPEASAPAPAAEGTPAEDHADPAVEEGVTPEMLQGEYAKLPPEELKMHLMAAQAAYMAAMGGAEEPAPQPEASAPAPAPEEAMKAEMDSEGNGGEIKAGNAVKKSEEKSEDPQIAELKKSLEEKEGEMAEIKETVKTLTEVLSNTLNRPLRKSVTDLSGVDFNAKPGSEASEEEEDLSKLSKSQVVDRLKEISASTLQKSDRDLITNYCVSGADISSIAHLLKK